MTRQLALRLVRPPAVALSICGLVLAAWLIALVHPEAFQKAPFLFRLLIGFLSVFYVPGRLLLPIILRKAKISPWEHLPFCFAISLCVVTVLTISIMELHWNSHKAAWLLLTGCTLLLVWSLFRPHRPAQKRDRVAAGELLIPCMVVAGLLWIAFLLYGIGGVMWPGSLAELGEESLMLSIVRKLGENDYLSRTNIMYKAGEANTYVYPPYHAALAFMSRISGLDPVAVFVKLRPFLGLISLLSMYSLLILLLPRRWVADVSMLALIVIALNNVGGQISGSQFGQLLPVVHWADFGLGVLLPLLALISFRFLFEAKSRGFMVLAPWFILSVSMIHIREVLQLLLYLCTTLAAMVLLRHSDTRVMKRLAVLIGMTVAIGLLYKQLHNAVASHAVEFESAIRAQTWTEFLSLFDRSFMEVLFGKDATYAFIHRPVFLLSVLATPFLLLSGRLFFGLLLWSGFLTLLLIIRVPYLSLLFVNATYAEMMMVPARNFLPWCFIVYGLVVCLGVYCADRLQRLLVGGWRLTFDRCRDGVSTYRQFVWNGGGSDKVQRFAFLATGLFAVTYGILVVVGGLQLLEQLSHTNVDALYLWALGGSGIAGAYLWHRKRQGRRTWPGKLPVEKELVHTRAALGWTFAILLPVYFLSNETSLWQEYLEVAPSRDVSDWDRWYEQSRLAEMISPDLLRFLREVPDGQVFAIHYDSIFAIPMLSNHYIIAGPRPLSTELDFAERWLRVTGTQISLSDDRYWGFSERMSLALSIMRGKAPLFNREESPELTRSFLYEFDPDYVIALASDGPRFKRVIELWPELLEVVYEDEDYVVLRVHE